MLLLPIMHLYNSTFTGWESHLLDHTATKVDGFNCKIPFFKVGAHQQIHFTFMCKQNISIEAGLIDANGELLVAIEKWYHAGEYNLKIDVQHLQDGLHFLSIKSVGRFLVKGIEIIQ
jgi:hypothetical protein